MAQSTRPRLVAAGLLDTGARERDRAEGGGRPAIGNRQADGWWRPSG